MLNSRQSVLRCPHRDKIFRLEGCAGCRGAKRKVYYCHYHRTNCTLGRTRKNSILCDWCTDHDKPIRADETTVTQ